MALFSNFFWNERLTFRARRASGPAGAASRLLHYQTVCAPARDAELHRHRASGAPRGLHPTLAVALCVLAGGLWNLLLNIPAIWRSWSASRTIPGRVSARGG